MSTPRVGTGRGLAALQRRRNGPGRPKKAPCGPAVAIEGGHNVATAVSRTRMDSGAERGAQARQANARPVVTASPGPPAIVSCPPRLLSVEEAGRYLGGLSSWTVRDLIGRGLLHPVRLPGAPGKDLRRVVLDRAELDQLVDSHRASEEAP